ncbi:hypothetical protein [Burkholderia anthina]|uniref:hypothetical protein n=1 Tax=Burkholderia anthina TaxID=179879 RepID=UPI00158B29A2|nr:hypothetical protein [Burkholderia anthina]
MGKLIANMRIDVFIDSERVSIPPGGEVTGLSPHDVRELKASGALYDEGEQADVDRKRSQDERKAQAAFQSERRAVTEAKKSREVPTTVEKSKAE